MSYKFVDESRKSPFQSEDSKWQYLRVQMRDPKSTTAIRVDLVRHPDVHEEGHWEIDMIGRPKGDGYDPHELEAKNSVGPTAVRALASHLKSKYGVKKVSGDRVTGVRAGKISPTVSVSLDKALNIRELHHTPGQILHLEFQHQDEPKRVNRIYLSRDPVRHPPGIWTIGDVAPAPSTFANEDDYDEPAGYLKNQNKFGVKNIRQLANHLKEKYGIRAVKGTRVTGVRQEKSAEEAQTTVRFEKAIRLTAHKPMPVQSGRYQQVKDDWHHEGTSENPLNQHKRVVEKKPAWTEGPSKIGTYRVSEDKSLLNHYFVNEVQAVTRGGGKAAMEHLTAAADRHGVSLSLVAEPLKPQGEGVKMTRAKLRAWYQQHGFRPSKGDLMTRMPARMEKSMDAPAPKKTAQPMPKLDPETRAKRAEGRKERGHMRRHALSHADAAHEQDDPSDYAYHMDQYHYSMDDADQHLAADRKQQRQENRAMTRMKKSSPALYSLYERLEKSWFMDRRVVFGKKTPAPDEGRTTSTSLRDGKVRTITTGPVKASRVPDAKKDKLKKEVTTVAAPDTLRNRFGDSMLSPSAEFVNSQLASGKIKTKDRDTTKYTFRRDGSVDQIRLFAKALQAYLQKARKAPEPFDRYETRRGDVQYDTPHGLTLVEGRSTKPTAEDPRTSHQFDIEYVDRRRPQNSPTRHKIVGVYAQHDPREHPAGEWEVTMAPSALRSAPGTAKEGEHKNSLKVGGVRDVLRHLNSRYGIEKVKLVKRNGESRVPRDTA